MTGHNRDDGHVYGVPARWLADAKKSAETREKIDRVEEFITKSQERLSQTSALYGRYGQVYG